MQNSGSAVPSTPDSQSDMDEEGWQIRQPRLSESEMIEMGENPTYLYLNEMPDQLVIDPL